MKKKTTDPLLALAGMLRFDISDIDPMPNPSLSTDSQDPENAEKRDAEEIDPLLALAGTWECDIPDLGERHDDYIADALIEELWGDVDEEPAPKKVEVSVNVEQHKQTIKRGSRRGRRILRVR